MKYAVTNVILTGGVGSRLWPLSRKSKPKQYLDLFSGFSLFENTIKRNLKIANKLIVVGNVDNKMLSQSIINKLYIEENTTTIIESTPRNTAAAIAFAAFKSNPNDILIVTPSDHIIIGEEKYKNAVNKAIHLAKEGFLVTFGIKPTRAETGFGYIEYKGDDVLSFREKPTLDVAESFLEKGNFCWNSGMFCFKSGVFLDELQLHEPEVYATSKAAFEKQEDEIIDYQLSTDIPSISVDYAVMEKSKRIKVVASEFEWSDLGSFESLYEYLVKLGKQVDKNGNMVIGTEINTSFVGLKNCILVHTKDAILVLNKANSQEVKNIYQELEKNNSNLL